jgi:hypothetical protein
VQADFQITPMLAQELFGLVQGCILGRMRCPYGLTTNGPDYNELLCHVSFPEPMKRPFGWGNHIQTGTSGQRFASSTFCVLPVASRNSRHNCKRPHSKEL